MDLFGKKQPEEKPVPETPKPETPKAKTPRTRRSKLEVAQEKLAKCQKGAEEARRVIAAEERKKAKNARTHRLMAAAGMMLKIVDDCKLPDGITDGDFIASMRVLLAAFRRQDGEEKDAWKARVAPAIDAIFGRDKRSPAQEAAIRILTGHVKAAETVGALRAAKEKGKSKAAAHDTKKPADAAVPHGGA